MVPIILFIVLAVMWVLLAVPRQREARRHNAVMSSLKIGDEVMTGGGIYGTVLDIADEHILLEIAPGTVMKLARRAVATRVEPDNAPTGRGVDSISAPDGIHSDSTVDATASDHLED
jgi:preprotein translocase subunit YajC